MHTQNCQEFQCCLSVAMDGLCLWHYLRRVTKLEVEKPSAPIAPQPKRIRVKRRIVRIKDRGGYIMVPLRSSPWPGRTRPSYVPEHRLVFSMYFGGGPFKCRWCSKQLQWGEMAVDHLNAIRDDNRVENLVASCAGCNARRAYANQLARKTGYMQARFKDQSYAPPF